MAVLAYVAARGPDRRSHLSGFPELLVAVPRVALAAVRGLPPARRLSAGTGPAPALAGARTRCRLDTKIGGDLPDFSFPLQSWRSMGTCYVTIPQVNQDILWASTAYLTQPASPIVSLEPGTGTSVDLADTSPRPDAKALIPGSYGWTCFDYSHPQISRTHWAVSCHRRGSRSIPRSRRLSSHVLSRQSSCRPLAESDRCGLMALGTTAPLDVLNPVRPKFAKYTRSIRVLTFLPL
jgi:hypothetical protein